MVSAGSHSMRRHSRSFESKYLDLLNPQPLGLRRGPQSKPSANEGETPFSPADPLLAAKTNLSASLVYGKTTLATFVSSSS